jgi:chemotaxis signal transduction protein
MLQSFRNRSTGTRLFGCCGIAVVDRVDQVLPVDEAQLEQVSGPSGALLDSIANLGERLGVLLDPDTISTTSVPAA